MLVLLLGLFAFLLGAPATHSDAVSVQPPQLDATYEVVNVYPHDPSAFTQGLDFANGGLFEGTGLNGESKLRKWQLETGEVQREIDIADKHFGEGITVLGRRIYQLTWRSGKAFVYQRKTFRRIQTFAYDGEGWGLTHNGDDLIMSNGTNVLSFRTPESFEVVRTIPVTNAGAPVEGLNELEWVNGEIYANVWPTDEVVRIDPTSGAVTGSFELSELREREEQEGDVDVTNGIAYLRSEGRLFVTGKYWAHVYEIELAES